MEQPMYTPEQLEQIHGLSDDEIRALKYSNAIEEWAYYDTFGIDPRVAENEFANYSQAGWLSSYSELGSRGEVSFFKQRNIGNVALAYCNMDVKDRFNLPFHVFAVGIQFVSPVMSPGSDPNEMQGGLLFSAELPKYCGFELRVGQDEKIACNAGHMLAGAGNFGAYNQVGGSAFSGVQQFRNVSNGKPYRWNTYPLPRPIQIPRNETIGARLVIEPQGKAILNALNGPASGITDGAISRDQRCLIRLALYGVREVQLRNLQHY